MTNDRVVDPQVREDDTAELSLRPRRLSEYIGQPKIKESLKLLLQAATMRKEAIDHILLYGPPGLGKTSLANVVAAELGVTMRQTSGPAVEHAGDLVAILTNLQPHDILFIDEIHRLNRVIEETLYPAMEDYAVDIIIGKGPSARSLRYNLPHITVIGATTRLGLISGPLRDRFGVHYNLEFYDKQALLEIVTRSADILKAPIDRAGAEEIAARSRGTPRVANRLLKRVRDFAQVRADGVITRQIAQQALALLEVDDLGLDNADRRLLLAIIHKFAGGPVGLDTLAAATSDESDTIEDVYEPYLLQLGFIQRTPRGRVATALAYQHLGLPPRQLPPQQATLFG